MGDTSNGFNGTRRKSQMKKNETSLIAALIEIAVFVLVSGALARGIVEGAKFGYRLFGLG